MVIAVVGLGLIGGSLCKSIKANTSHTVYGIETNAETARQALLCGVADKIITAEGLGCADICIVCLYPEAAAEFFRQNTGNFRQGCIITDVCGVKGYILNEAEKAIKLSGKNLRFVGGHPMAGKEQSGFAYSDGSLFDGASYILIKEENTDADAFDAIYRLVKALGAKPVVTTAKQHDRIIAYTSQLAHAVSSSYVKSPAIELERGFTGGSFQDMTRVALLSEGMWADLFLLNSENLSKELEILIGNLSDYRDAVKSLDREKLIGLLREGKEIKKKHLK